MPIAKISSGILIMVIFLGGCSSFGSAARVTADASAPWAVMPLTNLSNTPLAGDIAGTMVETRLRARGVDRLSYYKRDQQLTLASIVNSANADSATIDRAVAQGMRYILSGSVHEWRYKNGADKEPVVGISLKLTDLSDGAVIWQKSDSRSGWGFASLSAIGDSLIERMLTQLHLVPLSSSTSTNTGY